MQNPPPNEEQPQPKHHRVRTLLIVFFSIIGFFLLVAGAGLASYHVVYGQRIPLGVQILDIDVGGLEPANAKSLLSDNLEAYLRTPITLRGDGREWKATPAEFGANFDVNESVSRAMRLGQQGNVIEKAERQAEYLQRPQRLGVVFVFNETAFQGGVGRLAKDIEKPPQDASMKVAGTEVAVSASRAGARIDREVLKKRVNDSFDALSAAPIEIPVAPVPPQVKEQDFEPARKQVEGVLATPVTVKYGDKKWTLDRATLGEMITFQQGKDASGAFTMQASIVPDKAEAWAKGIAKEVNLEPVNARVIWDGARLIASDPGRPGVAVETEKFPGALNDVLKKTDRVVTLPVVARPQAGGGDISRLGVQDLISRATTSYAGTLADRISNVRLGASRIHGTVVPPGGIYSMAGALGPISEATGYKLGFAIVGNDTVLDVGGGLSQLTTTVFKAAFDAGFPIIERTYHYYRIRRYEPILGIEATIYPPAVDLKFRNDTDHFIVVDARTDAGNVTISMYGTKPNREISTEGPIIENIVPTDRTVQRVDSPQLPKGTEITSEVAEDGLDVTVWRITKVGGKEVKREKFFQHFRPSHNVIMVGTKED